MGQNSPNEGNIFNTNATNEQSYCNDDFFVSDNALSVPYATSPYGHIGYPFNEAPNNGSSSDIYNNIDVVYSNATNATQPGQYAPFDNYSNNFSNVPLNLSLPITNPPNNNEPSDIYNNNNGFGTIYSNVTQSEQFSDFPLNPPVTQNNAITENPLEFVKKSSLPTDSPADKTFNSSQAQTNDSGIFKFMIPGFQIIVIPVPSPGNVKVNY